MLSDARINKAMKAKHAMAALGISIVVTLLVLTACQPPVDPQDLLRAGDTIKPTITVTSHQAGDPFTAPTTTITGTVTDLAKADGTAGQITSSTWAVEASTTGGTLSLGSDGAFSIQIDTTARATELVIVFTAVDWNSNTETLRLSLAVPNEITSFVFLGFSAYPGLINQTNGTIAVILPYGTSLVALVAAFTTSAFSVKVRGVAQVSGVTGNDFRNPIVYTTVGQNGSIKSYTVTAAFANNNLITTFYFQGYESIPGIVDSMAGTIAVKLPYCTPVNALVAVFTTTGSTVKVGSAVQISGNTPNDFTNPQTYAVAAGDWATKNYVVTVDNGLLWTDQTTSGPKQWSSIAASSDGTKLVAAVSGGDIWTSTNSGASWTDRTDAAIGPQNWWPIASSSDGANLAAASFGGDIWTSADSGATWADRTAVAIGPKNWRSIASSSDGSRLAAVVHLGGDIWTSTDSGATWIKETTPGSGDWRGLAISSDGNKLVVGEYFGYAWTATYSGTTWTWTRQTAAGTKAWWAIASSADGSKLAAEENGGHIWISMDSGASWADQGAIGSGSWWAITSSADGTKIAATSYSGGDVWTATYSGAIWAWSDQTAAGTRDWRGITSTSDGTRVFAVASGGDVWTAK